MAKVLDASALMVYLEKEEGYEKVKELLIKAVETDKKLLMAAGQFLAKCITRSPGNTVS